jgi:hypothetical protein
VPVIFRNPAGAPELACDACGCRWFDRMKGECYECGTAVGNDAVAEYRAALAQFTRELLPLPPGDGGAEGKRG